MAKKRPKSPGRPPKEPAAKRDVDLRIPVTQAEKDLIALAVKGTDRGELASWARMILLESARQSLTIDRGKR